MNTITELINRILAHFAGDAFQDELLRAKSAFFDRAGVLDENLPSFELRMSQFFDWYFFTRPLEGYGRPPVEAAEMARELRFSEEDLVVLQRLRDNRHSLFEFRKLKGNDLYVKDLIKGQKLVLKESPWIHGFDVEEIFEARLIPYLDSFLMTKGLCFHPPAAKKFIMAEIKRHRKDPDLEVDDMMLELVKMRYRLERFPHVDPAMIYSHESKVRF
jgi:hypothetical protein